jgi:hypothetical protein
MVLGFVFVLLFGLTNALSSPLLFRKNIVLDESKGSVGLLEIYQNQEPADAIYSFAKQYQLDAKQEHDLLANICKSLTCVREEPGKMWCRLYMTANHSADVSCNSSYLEENCQH